MNLTQLKTKTKYLSPDDGLKLVESFKDKLKIENIKKYLLKEKERLINISKIENELYENHNVKYIGGVDEVGRGPLAGPVVTACVVLPENYSIVGINDSKKVSEKNREILSEIIKRDAIAYSIASIDNEVIDKINILEATKVAMNKCIDDIKINIDYILIDAIRLEKLSITQKSIIKGDEKSISIAAASIIAKVYRDNLLKEYDLIYPNYNFKSNKGYGSKEHINAIKKYGIIKIHRRSFVKNIV